MILEDIESPIATRVLDLGKNRPGAVTVLLGKPELTQEKDCVCCPFQIRGIGDEKVRGAYGEDEIQALQLAMVGVGAHLMALPEWKEGLLTWVGFPGGEMGFPRISDDGRAYFPMSYEREEPSR